MIGLFGGTFDPIHFGHLNVAISLKEIEHLLKVWFIPANSSPFPKEGEPISAKDRLAMVKLAIQGIPDFLALPIEVNRKPPSYTIDTLIALQKEHPKEKFILLLGEDVALDFYRWKEAEEIVKRVPLLIGSRAGANLKKKLDALSTSDPIKKALKEGVRETPMMDISATELRKRLMARENCSHLVPRDVLDFIYDNQLYFKG